MSEPKKLPTGEQMKTVDRIAIDGYSIPGIVLMENAGLATVLLLERLYGPVAGGWVPIFIGPGNNGGDGLVIARQLFTRGCSPVLFYLVDPARLTGDSAVNRDIVNSLGLPFHRCDSAADDGALERLLAGAEQERGAPLALVDALFGTGLDRPLEGRFKAAIDTLNDYSGRRDIPIVSVDTPSGLDSATGAVLGACIRARATAAYGCAKLGQVLAGSGEYTGDLHLVDISLPPGAIAQAGVPVSWLDDAYARVLARQLNRHPDSHKGTYGHLLVAAGSAGKSGAAILAARGALRSGCGLITLCSPTGLEAVFQSALIEPMTVSVEGDDTRLSHEALDSIVDACREKDCLVFGPGIGQDSTTAALAIELYGRVELPMVIDADGLNILAAHRGALPRPSGPRVLTPHPGEMARLLGRSPAAVQADRLAAAIDCHRTFESGSDLVVVLKGAATVIVSGGGHYVNASGNPGMAAGGMGDVLSGIIGGLVCQGLSLTDACCLGAYLHGMSGDRLQRRCGTGFSAAELADEIPRARQTLEEG